MRCEFGHLFVIVHLLVRLWDLILNVWRALCEVLNHNRIRLSLCYHSRRCIYDNIYGRCVYDLNDIFNRLNWWIYLRNRDCNLIFFVIDDYLCRLLIVFLFFLFKWDPIDHNISNSLFFNHIISQILNYCNCCRGLDRGCCALCNVNLNLRFHQSEITDLRVNHHISRLFDLGISFGHVEVS